MTRAIVYILLVDLSTIKLAARSCSFTRAQSTVASSSITLVSYYQWWHNVSIVQWFCELTGNPGCWRVHCSALESPDPGWQCQIHKCVGTQ